MYIFDKLLRCPKGNSSFHAPRAGSRRCVGRRQYHINGMDDDVFPNLQSTAGYFLRIDRYSRLLDLLTGSETRVCDLDFGRAPSSRGAGQLLPMLRKLTYTGAKWCWR